MFLQKIENLVKFDENGLVPAIVQNAKTREILMMAYMNEEAFINTAQTGQATFWSRSRNELWLKGETSGNTMEVVEIRVDCDRDCVLLLVIPAGEACHTGNRSCFYRKLKDGSLVEDTDPSNAHDPLIQEEHTVLHRKHHPKEGSYTNYLFAKGADKILKKVGEEAAEVVIAGKNRNRDEIKYEVADLMYHITVMLADNKLSWQDIYEEMNKRRG